MKTIKIIIGLVAGISFFIISCEDLSDINTNPNAVQSDRINLKYAFASILANTPNAYTKVFVYGDSHGIVEAAQYLQRDYIGFEINNLIWSEVSFNSSVYKPIKDSDYLFKRAEEEQNETYKNFYQGTALIMKAFYYGFYTSVWGDMPYSEAMKAEEGLFKPKYDDQKEIFKAVIEDLKRANEMLKGVGVIGELSSSDLLYKGDALQWQKFANSLRLRYYMRLSDKAEDFSSTGIDVVSDFQQILQNPADFPIFQSVSDNASIEFLGTESFNSWHGGPLEWSNRSEFYRRKPAATMVKALRDSGDPRLTTWIRPVDVQIQVRDTNAEYGLGPDGRVKRYIPSYQTGVDTALYVGLDIAMREPDGFNLKESTNFGAIRTLNSGIYLEQGTNPHVSYLADMYAENANPMVRSILLTYSELNFILAEAAAKGWITTGDVSDYYVKGIEGSLDQYQIEDGSLSIYNINNHGHGAFDKNAFLQAARAEMENAMGATAQLEKILTQKWIALWMTPEGWLNWRRTGIPDLGANVISGSNGDKIPVRFIYGNNEMNLNGENVQQAINRFSPQENTQWAKMWLLEGTGKPW